MIDKGLALFAIKNMWAAIGSLIVSILLPIQDIVLFVGMVIFIDTFLGSWAAIKKGGWQAFTSKRGLSGMVPKLLIYPMILFFASGLERLFDVPFAVQVTACGIMFWEGVSIHENARIILGVSIMKYILTYVRDGKDGIIQLMKDQTEKDA